MQLEYNCFRVCCHFYLNPVSVCESFSVLIFIFVCLHILFSFAVGICKPGLFVVPKRYENFVY